MSDKQDAAGYPRYILYTRLDGFKFVPRKGHTNPFNPQ